PLRIPILPWSVFPGPAALRLARHSGRLAPALCCFPTDARPSLCCFSAGRCRPLCDHREAPAPVGEQLAMEFPERFRSVALRVGPQTGQPQPSERLCAAHGGFNADSLDILRHRREVSRLSLQCRELVARLCQRFLSDMDTGVHIRQETLAQTSYKLATLQGEAA